MLLSKLMAEVTAAYLTGGEADVVVLDRATGKAFEPEDTTFEDSGDMPTFILLGPSE